MNNLAYSCLNCNRFKGSDIATITSDGNLLVPFFNPRTDSWDRHFQFVGAEIIGLTEIGKGTNHIFRFNNSDRFAERKGLIDLGLYF